LSWRLPAADGVLHLVMVRRCTRPQYLQFLLSLTAKGISPGQFDFVDVGDADRGCWATTLVLRCAMVMHWANMLAKVRWACPDQACAACWSPQVRTVSAAVMRQEGSAGSSWNVDGELMDDNSVGIRMHRGLVDVFARGPAC
jgi:hypothetical protein